MTRPGNLPFSDDGSNINDIDAMLSGASFIGANGWAASRRVILRPTRRCRAKILARVVGKSCNLDFLIGDSREELRGRPYELVAVASGWQHRTRKAFAEVIRCAMGQSTDGGQGSRPLTILASSASMIDTVNLPVLSHWR